MPSKQVICKKKAIKELQKMIFQRNLLILMNKTRPSKKLTKQRVLRIQKLIKQNKNSRGKPKIYLKI